MFDKIALENSDVFLHEVIENEILEDIINDFYPNLDSKIKKLKLLQAILIMNSHNENIKEYSLTSKLKPNSWFILPTAYSSIIKIISSSESTYNSIYLVANGINQDFELLFETEDNKKKFNLMVETLGLSATLSSLYATLSSYEFYYPYHFPQMAKKCREIQCEIEKNQNRYYREAEHELMQSIRKKEIRENEKKQRQIFIESRNKEDPGFIDKILHDVVNKEKDQSDLMNIIDNTEDGIWNEVYINTSEKVSNIFYPISNITTGLMTYRSKYEELIKIEAAYRKGKMKAQKYTNIKTKIMNEIRSTKNEVNNNYDRLNQTIVRNFKKDLKTLVDNNDQIALFKLYIQPDYGREKAKIRKYNKTYPFKLGSFLLSAIFKTLKWMNFFISKSLTAWDINNRYNKIESAYLSSKRQGDRQGLVESSGFLASAFLGYGGAKLGGWGGANFGFGIGFGSCLVTPLMPINPFCGFVGGAVGGLVGVIIGAGIGGTIGDYTGQWFGGFIDDTAQSAKEFHLFLEMNKHTINAPIILDQRI